jgi:hypothetical protein
VIQRLLEVSNVPRDSIDQILVGLWNCDPRKPPERTILTSVSVFEVEYVPATSQTLKLRHCGGFVGRMHKVEKWNVGQFLVSESQ